MMRRIVASVLAAVAVSAAAWAGSDGPAPFPEFTFKRVGVPTPGTTRRITVQIEPQADAPEDGTAGEAAGQDPALSYDWYWAEVSPSLSASAPGRLEQAVRQLAKGPGVPAPRVKALQRILGAYGAQILTATIGTEVSPALVLAVLSTESTGRADAVSDAGAVGLMQLMPETASRFGVADPADPADNIRGGVAYLDWLMDRFGGDPILVLAGYNAGENAVKRYEGVPPFDETRAYVPRVLAAWAVARAMCLTPPELISDGCAFALAGIPGDG